MEWFGNLNSIKLCHLLKSHQNYCELFTNLAPSLLGLYVPGRHFTGGPSPGHQCPTEQGLPEIGAAGVRIRVS